MNTVDMPERNEIRAEIEHMKRHMDDIQEYNALQAKILRAHFEALVAEGFTPEQALDLCIEVMP